MEGFTRKWCGVWGYGVFYFGFAVLAGGSAEFKVRLEGTG